MAEWRLSGVFLLMQSCAVLAVELSSLNTHPEVQEYQRAELSCIIKNSNTNKPRIEWKKMRNDVTSYVYFQNTIQGDLRNRAELKSQSSLVILNASRSDNGRYRCEVAAVEDDKKFAEIIVTLTVRVKPVTPQCRVPKSVPVGKSAVLQCQESEGYPSSVYQWYRNSDALPQDSKASIKFLNSSFKVDPSSGTLVFAAINKGDAGQYYCIASNAAGSAHCDAQLLEVYDLNIGAIVGGILVVALVLALMAAGICCAYRKGFFSSSARGGGQSFKNPAKADAHSYCEPAM
ncbi:junctional adhesion molecule C, partial [Gastrophryne carolinensis]